jgi:hypothetical protein
MGGFVEKDVHNAYDTLCRKKLLETVVFRRLEQCGVYCQYKS